MFPRFDILIYVCTTVDRAFLATGSFRDHRGRKPGESPGSPPPSSKHIHDHACTAKQVLTTQSRRLLYIAIVVPGTSYLLCMYIPVVSTPPPSPDWLLIDSEMARGREAVLPVEYGWYE